MSVYETTAEESSEIDDRTGKAVTECMGILPEGGDLYTVIGENHPDREQAEYTVDLRRGRCSCADSEYRNAECKHQRRIKMATGSVPVPAAFDPSDVPGQLGGDHLDGEPRFLATDGGVTEGESTDDGSADQTDDGDRPAGERVRVPVSGGILVFETRALGKELVGFKRVTDWDEIADALRARGHDTAAVYHLPELDDPDHREPTRSEPADFGHGESTGIKEL